MKQLRRIKTTARRSPLVITKQTQVECEEGVVVLPLKLLINLPMLPRPLLLERRLFSSAVDLSVKSHIQGELIIVRECQEERKLVAPLEPKAYNSSSSHPAESFSLEQMLD